MAHLFGLGPGHLGRRAARIARKHGARLVNYTEPNGHKRHWFSGPNLGAPFDGAMASAVMADLRAVGEMPMPTMRTPEMWWHWHDADMSRWSGGEDSWAATRDADARCAAWVAGESDDGPEVP